jgi:hypothetical protein
MTFDHSTRFFRKFTRKRVIIITRIIIITRKSIFITSDLFRRRGSIGFYLLSTFHCHEACMLWELEKEWLAWWSFAIDGYSVHAITFWFQTLKTWVSFLTNMSLTIRLLLSVFLVFLVAFVKLLLVIIFFLPVIWALGNEIHILAQLLHTLFIMNLLNFLMKRVISSSLYSFSLSSSFSSSFSSLGLSSIAFFFLLLLVALREISYFFEVEMPF